MRILVTGSSGHLGGALIRNLGAQGHDMVGLDLKASPTTGVVGSITDRISVRRALDGVEAVLHTATLHKPHVGFHPRQAFVDTNVLGTLTLLEEAVNAGVGGFVFTSTTSTYGQALRPAAGKPAAWITEGVRQLPRNVHGITKVAAENMVELIHRSHDLPCVILRVARFLPENADRAKTRAGYSPENVQGNEMLYRRVDLEDVVDAHRCALERAPVLGFGRYLVSATTPFDHADRAELRTDAPAVVARRFPEYPEIYRASGWRMFPHLDRVFVNSRARKELGWRPRRDFGYVLRCLAEGTDPQSELSLAMDAKGFHRESTGLYLVR